MAIRTFVVRVSETEPRVVVEDVRSRERVVAVDLSGVSAAIERLLESERPDRPSSPPSPAAPPA
ncbi:MAG TPA: hypothetical protein VGF74_13895 [Thermoleophilaceae bacterium]|jgi:hypothetical protein